MILKNLEETGQIKSYNKTENSFIFSFLLNETNINYILIVYSEIQSMFTINISEVYIPEPEPDPAPTQEPIKSDNDTNPENQKNDGLSSKSIGLIIGLVVGMLLVGSTKIPIYAENLSICSVQDASCRLQIRLEDGKAIFTTTHFSEYVIAIEDESTIPATTGGLGSGAIVGIIIAVLAVFGGGTFCIYWFVIRKKKLAK